MASPRTMTIANPLPLLRSSSPNARRRGLAHAAFALVLAVAAGTATSQTAVPIGGALKFDNDAVWSRLVELAGGKGARYVVFATAAGNPAKSAARIVETLQRHGAVAEHIPVAPRIKGIDLESAVRDPQWIDKVRAARGVFFSGGAQERIVDTLMPQGRPTPLLEAIREVYARGGVVAGTSAGAAMMSSTMFRDAQDVMNVLKGSMRDGKEIDRGLAFVVPGLFVDQHFLKRGRFGRMLPLMVAQGYTFGLGVDENSAAIIHGQEIEVIGAKGALLVDLKDASHDAALGAFNIRNARLSYLDQGDRYDLATRRFMPSEAKRGDHAIDPNAPDFKPYYKNTPYYMDMLGDTAIANAMSNLIDNGLREVRGLAFDPQPPAGDTRPELGFEFRLHKGADSRGWFTGAFGGEDYSVAHLYLDVNPVRVRRPLFSAWQP